MRDAAERDRRLSTVPMMLVTDCKSLYDCLLGVGEKPSEARLALDIDAIKDFVGTVFKWVQTEQMIASQPAHENISASTLLAVGA